MQDVARSGKLRQSLLKQTPRKTWHEAQQHTLFVRPPSLLLILCTSNSGLSSKASLEVSLPQEYHQQVNWEGLNWYCFTPTRTDYHKSFQTLYYLPSIFQTSTLCAHQLPSINVQMASKTLPLQDICSQLSILRVQSCLLGRNFLPSVLNLTLWKSQLTK